VLDVVKERRVGQEEGCYHYDLVDESLFARLSGHGYMSEQGIQWEVDDVGDVLWWVGNGCVQMRSEDLRYDPGGLTGASRVQATF
jgi:hypothetical protein